jgi:N-acetylmuramoyl-L-alanine amidase
MIVTADRLAPESPRAKATDKEQEPVASDDETEDDAAEVKEASTSTKESSQPAQTSASADRVQIKAIHYWSEAESTRVEVELEQPLRFDSGRVPRPDRVYVDLANTYVAPELKGKTIEVGDSFLRRIRVAPFRRGLMRVVLEVDDGVTYTAAMEKAPPRLTVTLRRRKPARDTLRAALKADKEAPKSEPETTPSVAESRVAGHEAKPTAKGDRSLIRALGLKVGRIVVDAGHGGHDTGTVGPTGLREKDLVLDVALRLGKLLENRLGAEVVYTRSDDTFIPLQERTAIANREGADLFISVHANSSGDPDARGVETYYLNFSASHDAMEVAARENATSDKSVHELQDVLKRIALTEKIEESREFAIDVQRALYSGLSTRNRNIMPNRGVKKAPFVVLIGANMPSILAEISFLSNPSDEHRLRMPEQRQKIAEALYRGVARYAGGLSGVKVASSHDRRGSTLPASDLAISGTAAARP